MKREIKFRFWTGKTMLDWLCVCQTAFNQFNVVYEYNQIKKEQEGKDKLEQAFDSMLSHGDLIRSGLMYKLFTSFDAVPMQFTGNTDHSGVNIYESDIVKWKDKIAVVKYSSDAGGFIIEWAYSKNQHHALLTCDVACECEVIGNIYENPELLKA